MAKKSTPKMGASIPVEADPIMPIKANKNPLKKKDTSSLTVKEKKTSQPNPEPQKTKRVSKKLHTPAQQIDSVESDAKKNKTVKPINSTDIVKKNNKSKRDVEQDIVANPVDNIIVPVTESSSGKPGKQKTSKKSQKKQNIPALDSTGNQQIESSPIDAPSLDINDEANNPSPVLVPRKIITSDFKVIVQEVPEDDIISKPMIIEASEKINEIQESESETEEQTGDEKLSRRARRLKEWREKKKLRKMQGSAEKLLHNENAAEEIIEEVISSQSELTEIAPESKDIASKKQAPVKKDKKNNQTKNIVQPDELPEMKESSVNDGGVKPKTITTQQNTPLLPLDKVGEDFPKPVPIDYGIKNQKVKVDPLPVELQFMLSRTLQFLERDIRLSKPATILVGVSGGVDSMVLLDILALISTRGWCTIHVAHCNHNLRGEESKKDEDLVRRITHKYGMHFHHTSVDVKSYAKQYSLSIEQAARILRYQFFDKAAKGCHADVIATAHNAEDNAETLLMNLMRGSGISGLAGIPPRRELDKKLSLIRPILWCSRKDIEMYAKTRNILWHEDESNASVVYTRNKIRHDLLPKLRSEYAPGLTEVLNRTTTLMREAQEFIAEKISHIMQNGVKEIHKKSFAIQLGMFSSLKDFAKGELIQASLRKYLLMQPVPMSSIDKIIQLSLGIVGTQSDINKDLYVLREREELVFTKREPHIDVFLPISTIGTMKNSVLMYTGALVKPETIKYGANPFIEYFDRGLIADQLIIRNWRDGDRFSPLGMSGSMTVSDFLANEKVAVADKRKIQVLCNGEDILWVVGYRINNQFKVTEHTKDILRVDIHMHDKLGQQKSELNKDSKVAENAKKVVDNKKTHVKEVSIKNKTKHNVLEETSENSQNDIKSVGIIPPKKGNTKKKPKNIM
jgi:tRNA(Ile)-lysidine synthase